MTRADAVVKAALALDKARKKADYRNGSPNSVWNAIERAENRLLRAVEKFAGLKRLALGVKDSR